jgi:hypothetical protein
MTDLPLGPLLNQLDRAGRPVFFRSLGPDIIPSQAVVNDLAALEEIVFIGYPSGLRDEHNSTPLIRRGINGEHEISVEVETGTIHGLPAETTFQQFRIHPEFHTLVWANGADFAPEFLHDNVRVTA